MADDEQVLFMKQEFCILVNEQDQETGKASKEFCHVVENIEKNVALHRAFSVFFFNTKGELLLQQRAKSKITFPLFWTNTCCSHPLFNFAQERVSQEQSQNDSDLGVKVAAIRKLEHELGVPQSLFTANEFTFLTRILYKAPFDKQWGEHEVDYCLIYKSQDDAKFDWNKLNYNEVEGVQFVTQQQLKDMMQDDSLLFTPWFKLIVNQFLWKWWDCLLANTPLEKDTATIHHLK